MERQIIELRQQGKSIRSITLALKVGRNTVRRVLRSLANKKINEAQLENSEEESIPWDEICKKRSLGYTVKVLHESYCGNKLSYWSFNRKLKKRMPKDAKVAIPMVYEPGRTAQVDYADGISIMNPLTGELRKTQLFCGVLPKSSYTFGEFTESQRLPDFLGSHERMFHYFGGVPKYVVHDNLKAGTTKAHRYDPDRNLTYVDFANHFGFASLPTRPRSPRDKGSVEAAIGAIQRSFYQEVRERTFYSLADLNEAFSQFLKKFNNTVMKDYGASRTERLGYERDFLEPLPTERYEIAEWKEAKVHPDCCVQVQKSLYSVPYSYIGVTVRIKITPSEVGIYTRDLAHIATHIKSKTPYSKKINDDHYPPEKLALSRFEIHSSKATAQRIGPSMTQYVEEQLSGSRPLQHLRRVQGVLSLAKAKGMSYQALEYAASQALTFKNPRLAFIKGCANQYLANLRHRPTKAPLRSLDTIFLHSKGDTP